MRLIAAGAFGVNVIDSDLTIAFSEIERDYFNTSILNTFDTEIYQLEMTEVTDYLFSKGVRAIKS